MNSDALSPRHRESPLTRRSRDVAPTTSNCLEVQWRFLQYKNLKLPQFGASPRKPLLVNPIKPQISSGSPIRTSTRHSNVAPMRDSTSRLFHMFDVQEVEADEAYASKPTQTAVQQQSNLPESPRASRTLNDLMGETQRQAMLDRILADMEYLAVEPTYSRLGQPDDEKSSKATSPRNAQRARSHKPSILQTVLKNEFNSPKNRFQPKQRKFTALWSLGSQGGYSDDVDDDDDDDASFDDANGADADRGVHDFERSKDRKRRQRRKIQQLNQEDEGPRIFWQKTTGARSAADVPARLLTLSPLPPRRMRSAHIVLGRRSYTSRQLLSPSTMNASRQRSKHELIPSTHPVQPAKTKTSSSTTSPKRRRRHNLHTPASPTNTAPASPPKAQYGAWYVPQSEWWALHQVEQQSLTDKLPASVLPASDAGEPHCHGSGASPSQRQHKPPLPPAALSPHKMDETLCKPTLPTARGAANAHTCSSRTPSASSRSSATQSSAPGPLELQVAGIPQSYIGREYRAYIISTGSAMPQYLQ
ncbi:unnamed protein product [Phytophthora lilii]|uniref:Unnamed protein product n=1 Tax=Phytophthora lilii TaxID=2077276 RepID=A0A9W6UFH5_9STRA|nr:unnamed protein product [Phytophthora lilii]